MKFFKLIPYYLSWHYSIAIVELISIWENYLWFVLNYFSVKILFLSLLKPFHNIKENTSIKEVKNEIFIVTFINSAFGFILKLMCIVGGILCWMLLLVCGLVLLFVWVFIPFILVFLFFVAIAGLTQSNI